MINKIKDPKTIINNIKKCNKCSLSLVRKKNCFPVVGRGSIPANILFIGEAPGISEEMIGEPFVGQSGKLLDKMLESTIGDNITYFITNCVMCRPTSIKDGDNRKPNPYEVIKCSSNLMSIYRLIQPKIVIFVGRTSEEYYKKEFKNSIFLYHPAYLLRGGGNKHPAYLTELSKLNKLSHKLKGIKK